MKKRMIFALCVLTVVFISACGSKTDASGGESESPQIPNPVVDYDTLDEAGEAAGFDIIVPDSIMEGDTRSAQVISGDILQVIYETDDNKVGVRKAEGKEDISGDYSVFSEVEDAAVGGRQVTLKGNDGGVSVAIWMDGGFTYAIFSDYAMDKAEISSLIEGIR